MNDDLIDLKEKPDLLFMMAKHYIYEAEIYLLKFEKTETKQQIQQYIDDWKKLYKN